MSPRWVMVDDTSSLISYQGPWTVVDDAYFDITGGNPYNNTLHSLSGSGSFTFNFTGNNVVVMGSVLGPQAGTVAGSCSIVDGNDLTTTLTESLTEYSSSANNNIYFCELESETETTPSQLTVTASGTFDNPFLFDYIQYTPVASTNLDNATVMVQPFDSQIQYNSGGWTINTSATPGFVETWVRNGLNPSMTFDFVGIQLTWITAAPIEVTGFRFNASTVNFASYRIDNGTQYPFTVTDSAPISSEVLFNNMTWTSFRTPMLAPGSHRLFVEYEYKAFDDFNVPLALNFLLIQNLTFPSFTPSSRLSKGAIAGIVVGSVVGLAFIIFFLFRPIKGTQRAAGTEPVKKTVKSKI